MTSFVISSVFKCQDAAISKHNIQSWFKDKWGKENYFFFQNVWKPNVQGGAQYDLHRNSRKNAVRNSKYFYSHMQTIGPLSLTSPHPFSAISLSGHWPPSVSAKPSWVLHHSPTGFCWNDAQWTLSEWMNGLLHHDCTYKTPLLFWYQNHLLKLGPNSK